MEERAGDGVPPLGQDVPHQLRLRGGQAVRLLWGRRGGRARLRPPAPRLRLGVPDLAPARDAGQASFPEARPHGGSGGLQALRPRRTRGGEVPQRHALPGHRDDEVGAGSSQGRRPAGRGLPRGGDPREERLRLRGADCRRGHQLHVQVPHRQTALDPAEVRGRPAREQTGPFHVCGALESQDGGARSGGPGLRTRDCPPVLRLRGNGHPRGDPQ